MTSNVRPIKFKALVVPRGNPLEISLEDVDAADAGLLARALDLALKKAGIPASAISLRRSSSESMDLGGIVEILNAFLHTAGAVGHIALCVYEFSGKHRVTVRLSTEKGSADIRPNAKLEDIEKSISELRKGTDAKG